MSVTRQVVVGTAAGRAAVNGWRLVVDALRGRDVDTVRGPVGRAVVMLAIPMVLEMMMESVFSIVDIFFLAKLGADAIAAVGLTESLMAVVYTVAGGLGVGVTAVVARRTGEGDRDGAARATVQALGLGVLLSVVLGVAGVLYAERCLAMMGASPEALRAGTGYAAVMLGGNGAVVLLFLLNAAFRGAGDGAIAMRVLWLANGLNILLDPLLIFGPGPFPELGVTGAAVATVIGRGVGVLFQLLMLFNGSGRLHVRVRHVGLDPALVWRLVRLSGAGTLQAFISTVSWIGLTRVVAMFGSQALAGFTVAMRIVMFALLPAWGLGGAAATMVGQGLGAGDADRAERSVWIAGLLNLVLLGGAAIVFLAGAPAIVDTFGAEGAAREYAVRCLRIVSCGFFLFAFGSVLTQSFNGAGDTWTPTWLNVLCYWCWELPLGWFLASRVGLGPDGVFAAVTISFSTLTLIAAALFRRGRWRRVVV